MKCSCDIPDHLPSYKNSQHKDREMLQEHLRPGTKGIHLTAKAQFQPEPQTKERCADAY